MCVLDHPDFIQLEVIEMTDSRPGVRWCVVQAFNGSDNMK